MTATNRPRLRFFENASNQRHITPVDRYLYYPGKPSHNLAVIGTGTIGQEHMRVASLLGRARIHGIYDTQAHSLDTAIANFQTYSADKLIRYDDLDAVCKDPDVDALMICTPNFTHFDVLGTAIKSGKPIFLEKPMATTLADAAAIVEIANNYSSFIQIGLQYRYKAQYVEAYYEALERETLGAIKTIAVSEYRPPFLDKVGQWNKFNCNTGGTLVEKCCHYFDLINRLAQSEPVRVYASGGQAVNFLDFERNGRRADIDDHGFVIIDYDNGIRANFTLNMFCPNFYEEMVVCGEKGRLLTRETFNFQQQLPAQTDIHIEAGEQGASRTTTLAYPRIIEQSGHHGATFYEHQAFIDQLEGRKADCATAIQGLWSMIVACAAQQSIASGAAVVIKEFLQQNNLSTPAYPYSKAAE